MLIAPSRRTRPDRLRPSKNNFTGTAVKSLTRTPNTLNRFGWSRERFHSFEGCARPWKRREKEHAFVAESWSSMQTLEYFRVPRPLQPYIGMVYSGIAEPGPTRLPAMMAQLWICTFPVYWCPPRSLSVRQLPSITLMGSIMGTHTVHVHQPGRIFGIGLLPRGWAELVRVSAAELTNVAVDGASIWPDRSARLMEEIQAAGHWPAQAERLIQFVQELLQTTRSSDDAPLIEAIDNWLGRWRPVEELSHRLGYSSRQVERITARTHGGPPRLLAARQRALRSASLLARAPNEREKLWHEYADQSHFIREFQRFIGGTPSGFGQDNAIGYSMFSKSWESDDEHPLAYGASSTWGWSPRKERRQHER